jgi:hypothetical protein
MRDDDAITAAGGDPTRTALLLRTLVRLLGIGAVGLRPALDEASQRCRQVLCEARVWPIGGR